MKLAAVHVYSECDNDGIALHGILCYHWIGTRTFTYICHCGVGARTVVLGVLGDDSGSVFCGILHYHWIVPVTVVSVHHCDVGAGTVVLGVSWDDSGSVFCNILRYHWDGVGMIAFIHDHIIGARTVVLGFSGCVVAFSMLFWQSHNFVSCGRFLTASCVVVVMVVGISILVLLWID